MANEMVKYHNNLVEAIYSFDLLPKKLLLGAICQVHDDGERLTVKESAKEFCERVGIDYRADHTHLKAAAMVLLKATIQMQMPDKTDWLPGLPVEKYLVPVSSGPSVEQTRPGDRSSH